MDGTIKFVPFATRKSFTMNKSRIYTANIFFTLIVLPNGSEGTKLVPIANDKYNHLNKTVQFNKKEAGHRIEHYSKK